MKILKVFKYYDREIFIIEVEDKKIHMFYRSIGETVKNSKEKILPCFLMSTPEIRHFLDPGCQFINGWISKIIISNNFMYRYFQKSYNIFPDKLKDIVKFINNLNYKIIEEKDPIIINSIFLEFLIEKDYKIFNFNLKNEKENFVKLSEAIILK